MLFTFFFFVHCDFRLTSWDHFVATFVLYGSSLLYTYFKIFFETWMHWAHLEYSQDMIKIEILTIMKWKPGQHVFARFLTGGHGLTSHPFSICSLPNKDDQLGSLIFYIKPRGGITGRLATLAMRNPPRCIRVFLDGPYGGLEHGALLGYHEVLLIAGGSGGAFLLPLLEDLLVCGCAVGAEPMKVHLVLAVREQKSLAWFVEALHEMAPKTLCSCAVELNIYTTSGCTSKSLDSGSDTEKGNSNSVEKAVGRSCSTISGNQIGKGIDRVTTVHHEGRPDLPGVIKESVTENESVAIVTCGPDSMIFDVRNAAAEAQKVKRKNVLLHTENFCW
jgi:NAD(P)H-flavin reductase